MAGIIESVQRYRKVEEATWPKDEPAPVYLLDEIVDLVRNSPEQAAGVADHVLKKLANKSAVVKFKALRLTKHLCTKGCTHFQKIIQRNSQSIRELVSYRGDPDPMKGDAPNHHVRELAKEVVEVMFNSAPVHHQANTLAAQGRIQGFGSAAPAAMDARTGGYSGIGSGGSMGGGGGIGGGNALSQHMATASDMINNATSALNTAVGGLWQRSGSSSHLRAGERNESPPTYRHFDPPGAYSAPSLNQVSASQVLGSEGQLVSDMCAPGGLRALPDPQDLKRFVGAASNMDGLRIAELLREKMEPPSPWQSILRALCALEAVLQQGMTQSCGEIAIMFQSDPGPVRGALSSTQPSVREKAAKVLKLLVNEDVVVPEVQPSPTATSVRSTTSRLAPKSQPPPLLDLLGDLDEPAPATATASGAGTDLLGELAEGLTGGNAATPLNPPGQPQPLPAPAPLSQPALSHPSPTPLEDLLGGLTTHEGFNTTPLSPQQPTPLMSQSLTLGQKAMPLSGQPPSINRTDPFDLLGMDTSGGVVMPGVPLTGGGVGAGAGFPGTMGPTGSSTVMPTLGPGGSGPPALISVGPVMGGLGPFPSQPLSSLAGPGPLTGPSVNGSLLNQGVSPLHQGATLGQMKRTSWSGNDDVSSLMRNVGSGGRHDPAFDFLSDEFRKK